MYGTSEPGRNPARVAPRAVGPARREQRRRARAHVREPAALLLERLGLGQRLRRERQRPRVVRGPCRRVSARLDERPYGSPSTHGPCPAPTNACTASAEIAASKGHGIASPCCPLPIPSQAAPGFAQRSGKPSASQPSSLACRASQPSPAATAFSVAASPPKRARAFVFSGPVRGPRNRAAGGTPAPGAGGSSAARWVEPPEAGRKVPPRSCRGAHPGSYGQERARTAAAAARPRRGIPGLPDASGRRAGTFPRVSGDGKTSHLVERDAGPVRGGEDARPLARAPLRDRRVRGHPRLPRRRRASRSSGCASTCERLFDSAKAYKIPMTRLVRSRCSTRAARSCATTGSTSATSGRSPSSATGRSASTRENVPDRGDRRGLPLGRLPRPRRAREGHPRHGLVVDAGSTTRRSPRTAKGSGQYLNSVLAVREARGEGLRGGDPARRATGNVSEGSGENIFLVKDGVLVTPGPRLLDPARASRATRAHARDGPGHSQSEVRPVTRGELTVPTNSSSPGTAAEITPIREVDGYVDRHRQARSRHRAPPDGLLPRRARRRAAPQGRGSRPSDPESVGRPRRRIDAKGAGPRHRAVVAGPDDPSPVGSGRRVIPQVSAAEIYDPGHRRASNPQTSRSPSGADP